MRGLHLNGWQRIGIPKPMAGKAGGHDHGRPCDVVPAFLSVSRSLLSLCGGGWSASNQPLLLCFQKRRRELSIFLTQLA